METELTKTIKKLTHTYKPKMSCKSKYSKVGRTIRYADEVWTPNGIVDSIRFEDYVVSRNEECILETFHTYDSLTQKTELSSIPLGKVGHCKIENEHYPNKNCKGCFYLKKGVPIIDMLITAYEIKISKSDFKSKNGHNIDDINSPIANENYYCLPQELIKEVEDLVPTHVGILSYKNGRLRLYKQATFIDVPMETKVILLYNSLKKWCDSSYQ